MKYWVYLNGEVPGSYEPEELAAIPGFGETALVCPAADSLAERRWERAGAYADIAEALRLQAKPPPAPPQPPAVRLEGSPRVVTPDEILSDSSQRLFRHVTELMKELENRREERALTQSLQRRVAELSNELTALRERAGYLQGRADLIPGFQDRERELQEALARLKADLHETRQGADRLDADLSKSQSDLQAERRHIEHLKNEAAERETHLAELSRRLSEKEATLAKAFGVIRRLEESLGELLPGATAGIAREVPGYPEVKARAAETPRPVPKQAGEIAASPGAAKTPTDDAATPRQVDAEAVAPQSVAREDAPAPEVVDLSSDPMPEPVRAEPPPPTPPPYSLDRSPADEQSPLPPEGEVTPVPPPWQEKLSSFVDSLKKRFGR